MLTRNAPLQRRTELRNRTPMPRGKGISARPRAPRGPGLAQRVAQAAGTSLDHRPAEPSVFRSAAHLRHVAALPCVCCDRQGMSQAAHLNLLALGKGRGLKCSDAFVVPLCADEPGRQGCHSRLDQGGVLARAVSEALQLQWFDSTRTVLDLRDQWPARAEQDYQRILVPYLLRLAAAELPALAHAGEQVSP